MLVKTLEGERFLSVEQILFAAHLTPDVRLDLFKRCFYHYKASLKTKDELFHLFKPYMTNDHEILTLSEALRKRVKSQKAITLVETHKFSQTNQKEFQRVKCFIQMKRFDEAESILDVL